MTYGDREMKTKKWFKGIATILLLGFITLFVEVVSLNGITILRLINPQFPKNIIYTMDDFETYNWNFLDNSWYTGMDPMLVINDLNYEIDEISIDVSMKPQIPYVQIFYTNSEYPYWGDASALTQVTQSSATLFVRDFVEDLRIDLGDNENCKLESLTITVNPTELTFSFPILIAVVLIYLSGHFLFLLHRPPDYNIPSGISTQEE